MTKTLVVLRHAKSAWPEGVPDLDRPLGERGHRDAPEAGRWLAEAVPNLQLVLCSPALRAKQTWELAAAQLARHPEVHEEQKIYYGPLIDAVRALPEETSSAMLVGHNPDVEDLVALLAEEAVQFKTSTIAVLRSEQPWADAGSAWATLIAHTTPRGK
jgi:phosphohistidine phosphatase